MFKIFRIILITGVLLWGAGCVYYNTFYNAKKAFNDAEKKRKELSRIGSKSSAGSGQYRVALEKSQKILDKHTTSKYYDDALYVNGVSHYWSKNYEKAGKRFRELIANFPESPYFKETQLYLAKSKLKLKEEDDAMEIFQEIYFGGNERWIQADAALVLGEYYMENREFDKAEQYFQALVDSLGDNDEKILSKMYLADGYFDRFRYSQAMKLYGEVLEYELSSSDKYKAKFRSGECLYFLNDIEGGRIKFEELAANDIYFDSLQAVKLMIAQGYDWEGDIQLAAEIYEEVSIESPRTVHGSYAFYMLGLISQYEYEDYSEAKTYYEQAKGAGRNSDVFDDAQERSANIGKLEEYLNADRDLDSTAAQEELDQAAETQYLLGEIYLTKMDKPDSALQEFKHMVDNFPESYLAPKAMLAAAVLHRDHLDDTATYDQLLDSILVAYPHSDYLPDILELKGLLGSAADTGYASLYYDKAESFAFDEFNYDSAQYYFALIADSFPNSFLNEKAKFASLWLTEEHMSPGDSTLYYAYLDFSDSFPDSKLGKAAEKKLVSKPRRSQPLFEDEKFVPDSIDADGQPIASSQGEKDDAWDENRPALTLEERCQRGPDGEDIWSVQEGPTRFEHPFMYPPEAYSLKFEGSLCFQVIIDPFGYVEDIRLVTPTESEALNEEATETVNSAQFPTYWIQPEYAGQWFLYKYTIKLPASLR